jgi:S-disulfanyl-L-cysteine oxidoreductase SoxD
MVGNVGTDAEFENIKFHVGKVLHRIRGLSPRFPFLIFLFLVLALSAALGAQSLAPSPDGKIWDGTYTVAQAERGKKNFTTSCERCHLVDLSGGTGPALKGTRFFTNWENESLYKIFTKIRDTMPPNFGTTLTDDAKLDVLTYILQTNGFPAGPTELKLDQDLLESIPVLRKGANRPAVPNFSMVEVVGCLTKGPNSTWILSSAGEPAITKDQPSTSAELKAAESSPPGTHDFRLISVNSFMPDLHSGQRVEAKGLIYRETGESRLNVTSLQMVAPNCTK